ncbi:MAG: hypothetical protein VXZ39_14380 [Planctomycetota bacterium]|nr:hypothetical protein [Planctomycetota bacterium]
MASWFNSMTPQPLVLRGGFEEARGARKTSEDLDDLRAGGHATYRTVEIHDGPDPRTFEMFMQAGDAPDAKLCRHVQTRRT